MISTSIMFAIINAAVCMPVSWLSGNTHKLTHNNWGDSSFGCVFESFHTALNNILDDITLIHDKSTMMLIFQKMVDDIPEFKAFLVYEFQNKKT